ncbi:hypothetical protein [Glaciihabitans sp. dw_435]|uniref:hypothetical protein n=1 Tax=Glaciihabitans sp. dw_435 TaxID=2720081 RepID=UPI0021067F09|nr:hypothetical protein [Glaciihabitans sp. dw_435]
MMATLTPTVSAAASGQFLGVDWGNFVVVFIVALLATVVAVVFYAAGLRLLSHGELEPSPDAAGSPPAGPRTPRPALVTTGAFACFAVAAAAILYGLYLAIPQFH